MTGNSQFESTMNWPSQTLHTIERRAAALWVLLVSAATTQPANQLTNRRLRLDVAVEPVVGDEPAGDDDAAPRAPGRDARRGAPRRGVTRSDVPAARRAFRRALWKNRR